MLELAPGAAHLWYVFSDLVRDEALLSLEEARPSSRPTTG